MSTRGTTMRLLVFVITTTAVLGGLVAVFGQFRFARTTDWTADFTSASGLGAGDAVRVAGVTVGSVSDVAVIDDHARVSFDLEDDYRVTDVTRAVVRYENLVGDRFLELQDGSGPAAPPRDRVIPVERTSPALDLDRLLGGFRPLFDGLDPEEVNRLSTQLISVLQGQGGTVAAVLDRIAALTSTLADRDEAIGRVVDNLRTTLGTLSARQTELRDTVENTRSLVAGLAADADPWVNAVAAVGDSTGSLAGALGDVGPPLDVAVDELTRTAAQLRAGEDTIGSVVSRLPDTYSALSRLGAYGNFFNYYLCGIRLKIDTPDGRGLTTPLIGQTTGRCAPA
ncbi:phospholipid/cholesterol/gamma-HCH transport system substrate-binding protein [Rhodococcoides kroppenstedtii]|uniref:Phospholipid/cholesterol/gamma-HCH transport system substrate-binding protein n=1 Tax=Rhodococcoides kroppenstedtii TaxID=293050 RepID=A0A1I0UBU6_9NOCA|nr:MCE family protein [Rhodococcus kroppenstedtii]SFA61542.1 phospholipid/cholesterol/gamma-HCH transport system substrate-binding protein [Rhodococcus kroppenstedtii]